MAWTQADVDTLKAVIATGVLTVQYDGPPKRMIVYQSTAAMEAALARMVIEVAANAGTRTSFRFAATKKGFYPNEDDE